MGHDPKVVTYAVDMHDRMIDVDENWQLFSDNNEGGEGLWPDSVLGRSLWDYVRGESLQAIYRQLLHTVRTQGQSIAFDYRCDSPTLKRFMRMQMALVADEYVQFVSHTMRIEPQPSLLWVSAAVAGDHHVRRCSMCNLFRLPDGLWSEAVEVVTAGRALAQDRPLRVVWSVCQSCTQRVRGAVAI